MSAFVILFSLEINEDNLKRNNEKNDPTYARIKSSKSQCSILKRAVFSLIFLIVKRYFVFPFISKPIVLFKFNDFVSRRVFDKLTFQQHYRLFTITQIPLHEAHGALSWIGTVSDVHDARWFPIN